MVSGYLECSVRKAIRSGWTLEQTYKWVSAYPKVDNKFFFWHGSDDTLLPPRKTFKEIRNIFKYLRRMSTIQTMHVQKGKGHELTKEGVEAFIKKYITGAVKKPKKQLVEMVDQHDLQQKQLFGLG